MARLVLVNLGLHGHINPTLAMARLLVKRGHAVFYFAPEEFRTVIEETGARFQPYRSRFLQPVEGYVDADGRTAMPIRLIADCRESLPQMLAAIAHIDPDAILFDVMCLQGRLIAEILQKPAIRMSTTFVLGDHVDWKPKAAGDPKVLEFTDKGIKDLVSVFGISPFHFQDIFTQAAELNVVFTSPHFQPRAETFDERFAFVGCGVDAAVEDKPPTPRPFVYVALGSLANNRPEFYLRCLETLQEGGEKQVLLAVGAKIDLAILPAKPGFEIVRHALQLQILQTADVFVSHAGMNSMMEALHFGVPMVLFPQTEEQVLNAKRLVALGAGLMLEEDKLDVGEAVNRILRDRSFSENARALQKQIHACGGFRRAADRVLQFIEC